MVQIRKEEGYQAGTYGNLERFTSYFYQARELLATKPGSIVEVGVGDGVVSSYIKQNTNISYTTADFAEDLRPDVVADIRKLPFADKSFDTTCAFEVLEHLPFDDFDKGLSELARVARNYVCISLPHFGPPVKFLLKLPFLPEIKFAFKIPFQKTHVFNGQHYWEIGKKGYSVSHIRDALSKYGVIEHEFVPFENQYHHFFRIRV